MLGSDPIQDTSSIWIGPVPWPKKAKENDCDPVRFGGKYKDQLLIVLKLYLVKNRLDNVIFLEKKIDP